MTQRLQIFATTYLILALLNNSPASTQRYWLRSNCSRCESQAESLLTNPRKIARISSQGTKKRAIHLAPPSYPSTGKVEGTITVEVLINPNGKAECIRIAKGHPLFSCAVADVSKQWEFQPMEIKGQRNAFVGQLHIHFSFDAKVKFVDTSNGV